MTVPSGSKHTVYGIFYDDPEPICIYVGVTKRPITERFAEHRRNAKDTSTTKPLYFYIRKHNLHSRIYITALEEADGDFNHAGKVLWEAWWIRELEYAGHPLQNVAAGNKQPVRKKQTIHDLYKQINKQISKQVL